MSFKTSQDDTLKRDDEDLAPKNIVWPNVMEESIVGKVEYDGDMMIRYGDLRDVIEFAGDVGKSFWEKDDIDVMIGYMEHKEIRDAMKIRMDNPVRSLIRFPLAYVTNSRPLYLKASNALLHAKTQIEYYLTRAKFDEYFGVDRNCPTWVPKSSIVYTPCLCIPRAAAASNIDFASLKPMIVRFYIIAGLISHVWSVITGKRADPLPIIFNPAGYAKICGVTASFAARFRHDVIWPLFQSTKNFWERLEMLFGRVQEYSHVWPEHEPNKTVPELRDYLIGLNDPANQNYIQMSYALEALVAASPDFMPSVSYGLLDPETHWAEFDEMALFSQYQ